MTEITDKFLRCATVAQRLRQPLTVLANIYDAGTFFSEFRFKRLFELGELLGDFHVNGHGGRRYDKSSVFRFNTGERQPTPDTVTTYGLIADQILRARSGGRIRVRLEVRKSGKWKLIPESTCVGCERTFSPEGFHQSKCLRCLRKG